MNCALDVSLLCATFGLGPALREMQPAQGGLLHRMWRLEAPPGVFAVKELNPEIIARPGVRPQYRLTERIAAAAAAAGLPAVAALDAPGGGGPLQEIGSASVLVYPWVEGRALPLQPAGPEYAYRIGALLGRLHALDLPWPGPSRSVEVAPAPQDWARLAALAGRAGAPWAGELSRSVRDLERWSCRAGQAARTLSAMPAVVSHRDLDQKNVLWQGAQRPALIDWEAAGPVSPALELASAALDWGGLSAGLPDRGAFAALLAGYRNTGQPLHASGRTALQACFGPRLAWLDYNLRRALGEVEAAPDARALAGQEIMLTLKALSLLAANLDAWSAWFDAVS